MAKRRVPGDILEIVCKDLAKVSKAIGGFAPRRLLETATMAEAAKIIAGIDDTLSVLDELKGYAGWLAKLPKETSWNLQGKNILVVAINQKYYKTIYSNIAADPSLRQRIVARLLGVVFHEVGHVSLGHARDDKRFTTSVEGVSFHPDRSLVEEHDAWLYSCFVRGFVFADIGGMKAPDNVPLII
jgi:hypothetical protein